LAISLQKYRLKDMFDIIPDKDYKVIGEPTDLGSARQLASENRYQFQWWALSLAKAKPIGGEGKTGKKGKDRGIDGMITFIDDKKETVKDVLVQVKSGKISSRDVRDLRGTVERENACMGVFVTLEPPTSDMLTEAVSAGFYESGFGTKYPRLQICTVEELQKGYEIKMPPFRQTFKQAKKEAQGEKPQQAKLWSSGIARRT
jgi:site-specific DNA-methyltransferase (adenine-specific)